MNIINIEHFIARVLFTMYNIITYRLLIIFSCYAILLYDVKDYFYSMIRSGAELIH